MLISCGKRTAKRRGCRNTGNNNETTLGNIPVGSFCRRRCGIFSRAYLELIAITAETVKIAKR
jgi:hypothetical protein